MPQAALAAVRGRDPWKPGLQNSSSAGAAHSRSYYVPPPSGGMHNHKPASGSASLLDDDDDDDDDEGQRRNDDDDRELGDDDDEDDDVLAGKIYSLPGAGPTGARHSSRQVARAAAAMAARAALEAARAKARQHQQQQQANAHQQHQHQHQLLGTQGGGRGAAHKRRLEEVAKSAENAIKGAIAARNAEANAANATLTPGGSASGGSGGGLLSDGDDESRDGFIAAVNMQAAHAALDELLDEDFLGGMGGTSSGHSSSSSQGGRQSTDSDQGLHRLTNRMGAKPRNSIGSRVQGRQKRAAVGAKEGDGEGHATAADEAFDHDDENMAGGGNGSGGVPVMMKLSPSQAFSEQEFPRADLPQLFKWSPPPKGSLVSATSRARKHHSASGAGGAMSALVEESPPNMGNNGDHSNGSACSESPEPSSASSLQSADHPSLAASSGNTTASRRVSSLTGGSSQQPGGPLPEPMTSGQYITPHQGRRLRRRAAQVSVIGTPDLASMPPPSRSSATSLEGGNSHADDDDDGGLAGAAANLLSPLGTSAFEAVAKSSAARALPISAPSSSCSRRSARSGSVGGADKDGISALLSASSKSDHEAGEPCGHEAELLTPSPALLAALETGAAYRQPEQQQQRMLRSGASSATSPGSGGSGGGFAAGQHAWVDGSHAASTGGTPSADRRFSPLASPALSDVFYTAGLSPGEFMSPIGLTPFKSPAHGAVGVGVGPQDRDSRSRDLRFSAVGPTSQEGQHGGGEAQLVPASATQPATWSANGRSCAGLGHSDCSKHDEANTISSCDSKIQQQQQQPVPFSSALNSGSSSVWSANSNAASTGRIAWSARELDASASVVGPNHNETPSSSASRGGAIPGAMSSSGTSSSNGGGSGAGRDAMQSPPLAFTQHDFLTLLADSSPLPSKDFKKLPAERGSLHRGVAAARHASVAKHLVPPIGNNSSSAHCGGAASDALDAATPSDTPGAAAAAGKDLTPLEARERAASAVNFMDLLFAGASRYWFGS